MMVSEPPHQHVVQHGQSTNEVMLLEHHASTTAMLAQANALPNNVLSLLKG